MDKTWVVVAESSRARLFTLAGPRAALEEVEDLAKPTARQHEQQLNTDLPGRSFDSHGQGRHAMEEPTSPKQYEAIDFSRDIAERLDRRRAAGELDKLVLIAEPSFLGLLRRQLSSELEKCVVHEVDKSLVTLDAARIQAYLPERL